MKSPTNLKIFLIRLSSIGDIVLTTGIIRMLRNAIPESEIFFITDKKFAPLLSFNPYLNGIIEYDKSFGITDTLRFAGKLNEQISENDIVIDLHNNLRTKIIMSRLKARKSKITKNLLYKLLLVRAKMNIYGKAISVPEVYSEAANKIIPLIDDGKGLEVWLDEDSKAGEYLPYKKDGEIKLEKIVIAPGANHFTKRWLPEYFANLSIMLNAHFDSEVSIIGGSDDINIAAEIEKNGRIASNLCGKLNLSESARVIRNSDLFVGNDTGMMHIAAAMQTPVVAVFGSSVREFGFSPYRVRYTILEQDLKCRPCSHIGRSNCPKGHFDCMTKTTPNKVLAEIAKFTEKL